MSRKPLVFWAVVLIQIVFLLGWAGYHEWVRQNAPTVLLRPRPVDPRDLLRGDYMILDYDVRHIALPEGEEVPGPGSLLYVVLEKRGEVHEVAWVSSGTGKEPEVSPGQVWVRGRVDDVSEPRRVVVSYGIEDYYVPEGRGTPQFERLLVEAAVSPDHRLYIRQLLLDGKPYP
ncbi:MAG TPA: GDYXXLXY domain-containing protein [Thermoanaerobaculia bacterium]|nr:GDYXXLXY domain-containing protein [Thermoanaerobaculia bacterium]